MNLAPTEDKANIGLSVANSCIVALRAGIFTLSTNLGPNRN